MKTRAYLVFAGCLSGLCLRPVFLPPRDDAYPFSTYPMFAARREQPVFGVVEATDEAGRRRRVRPELVVGTDEVMQAAATAGRAIAGARRSRKLCQKVAGRIRASGNPEGLVRVEVVRVKFDPLTYFQEGEALKPSLREVRASCKVSVFGRKERK